MQIEELIKLIREGKASGISANSGLIAKNFIFVAVKGAKLDGSKFIAKALDKGAKFVVCDALAKIKNTNRAAFIKVQDTRKAAARLAAQFYKNPSDRVKVIGITGTNGKTTISYLLEALLKEARLQPGVIGTINYRFKNKIIPAKNTTPGPIEMQALLADMAKDNIDYAALEVSSHALDQDRVEGVEIHSAIFTNLTQDHLDYHKNMERYFKAKAKLFKNLGHKAIAVINNDDKYGRRIKKLTRARVVTYGLENKSDVMAKDLEFGITHTKFSLMLESKKTKFKINLIGRHNIYNVLAAIAWGIKEGLSLSIIKSAMEKFSLVPGRLERIEAKRGFNVFVDYAHTDDALKNVLNALRQLSPKRIITIFGCGGERDKLKRPKMGRVVTGLSDFTVITSDNPRSENPIRILEDILKGINDKFGYYVIPQRKQAIRKALSLARAGDIVLVAGKGHEDYQVLNGKILHFDDREEVKKCLRSLNY